MLAIDVVGSLLLGLAIVVVLVGAVWLFGRRRGTDGVDSFRRQIDALSPEARRTTVDQAKPKPPDDGDAHGT